MRITKYLLPIAFASACWGSAQASESIVTLSSANQELIGTLSLPDGDPAPVVLLLHGFTGARDELKTDHLPEGVFSRNAQRLRKQGLASLRIDFRGSGESLNDMTFAETTFNGQLTDAMALWAAVGDAQQTRGGLLGADVIKTGMAAAANEATKITLPWGSEIELNGAFLDGAESFDSVAEIRG